MAKAGYNAAKRLCETYARKRGLSALCFKMITSYSNLRGDGRAVFRATVAEPHALGDIVFSATGRTAAAAWKACLRKIAESGVSPEELAIDGDLI